VLFGSSFKNYINVLVKYGGVSPRYLPRLFIVSLGVISLAPHAIFEKLFYAKKIREKNFSSEPIFILGHWRSGTTALHNLLCKDPNMGYISLVESIAPWNFLARKKRLKTLDWVISRIFPTRPQDNVNMSMNLPAEEGIAMANMCPLSFYHCLYFPQKMQDTFNSTVLLEGQDDQVREAWKKQFLYLIKKLSIANNGKRLVFKDPANTARIKVLLELFPNAKFINIYRNPYDVFTSTKHMYKRVLPILAFQDYSEVAIEENILNFYKKVMRSYFAERQYIPDGNLVEIRFEEFERNPLGCMDIIYHELGIPGWEVARKYFEEEVSAYSEYKKNVLVHTKSLVKKVNEHWGFVIDALHYSEPENVTED